MSLESKQEALEHAFIENNKILEATHGVVTLILNDQRELRKEQLEMKREFRSEFSEFKHEMRQEQGKLNQRFDQFELLIRQHFTQS